jgi:hypothetical protein
LKTGHDKCSSLIFKLNKLELNTNMWIKNSCITTYNTVSLPEHLCNLKFTSWLVKMGDDLLQTSSKNERSVFSNCVNAVSSHTKHFLCLSCVSEQVINQKQNYLKKQWSR